MNTPTLDPLDPSSVSPHTTRVYKMGLLPIDVPEAAIEELYQCNVLWNNLVAFDQEATLQYNQILLDADAGFAAANQEYLDIKVLLEEKLTQWRRAKQKDRSSKGGELGMALRKEVLVLKARQKELYQIQKAKKVAAREAAAPAMAAHYKWDYAQVRAIVKAAPLVWSNSSLILADFEVARKRARGTAAKLNFHSFDGTGRWGFARSGGITLDDVKTEKRLNNKPLVLFIGELPDTDSAYCEDVWRSKRAVKRMRHVPFTMRVADEIVTDKAGNQVKQKVFAKFTLVMHRDFPANARIQSLEVLRTRIGMRWKYDVCFTLRIPNEEYGVPHQAPTFKTVALDMGFRSQDQNGALMVAATWDGTNEAAALLPRSWMEKRDYCELLSKRLQDNANALTNKLVPILKQAVVDEKDRGISCGFTQETHALHRTLMRIAKYNPKNGVEADDKVLHHQIFHKLFNRINRRTELLETANDPAGVIAEVWQYLNLWFPEHLRTYKEQTNLAHRLNLSRKEMYRIFAKTLAEQYSTVVVESLDLATMAQTKDGVNPLLQAARKNRVRASLHELVGSIKNACANNGSAFVLKEPAYTTKVCNHCLAVNEVNTALFKCSACGTWEHQDVNAAKNLYELYATEQASMHDLVEEITGAGIVVTN